ncbi:nectin-4-like isoform X2 [Narcine bancroftii]|uniref:nectin-4-like isoform X2 n=1 Tax=Narcine bancroftii TaxID=1343680 RepID=UPI003831E96C
MSQLSAFLVLLLIPSGILVLELQVDLRTVATLGGSAHLRCVYQGVAQVTQVTWDKLTELGWQMVAVRSGVHGSRTHPFYGSRARFLQPGDQPDASLLIQPLALADSGNFRCKVFTFPAGNFEGDTWLTVLVPPQVWVVQGPRALLEGERRALAASCVVMGSQPAPNVQWQTSVSGDQELMDTANENGTVTVTAHFYLRPERGMSGKDMVCFVNHSTLLEPLLIHYSLNIYYVPEVMVRKSPENWDVEMEGAELQCEENGNPPATNFVWKRDGKPLPKNLIVDRGKLLFNRRLTVEDSGTYICEVSNEVGSRSAQTKVTISDTDVAGVSVLTLALVVVGVVGLVLMLIFIGAVFAVHRSHRKKTEQMAFKLEEIHTLSRQPSIRRCNSMSTSVDVRLQETGGSRDIDSQQLEQEPILEEVTPQQRSSSRDLLSAAGENHLPTLPLGSHRYSLRSTASEPRTSTISPFGNYRNSLPSSQRHSIREWTLGPSERSGSPGDAQGSNNYEIRKTLEQTPCLTPSLSDSQTEDEEEVVERQRSIHAAMGHFYLHNGTLRAKPGSSNIYIARRENCV